MNRRIFGAVLALGFCVAPSSFGQSLDNRGNEFLVAFLTQFNNTNVEVHLTSDTSTQVTINYPVNSPTFTDTVNVTPGEVTIVSLPSTASSAWTPGVVQNNGVSLVSEDEFVCYLVNRFPFTSDAAMALPVDALNTDYVVGAYTPSNFTQFALIAPFDNTVVTVTPTTAMVGGIAAGVPFDIMLNRGECFQGRSASGGAVGDLTGTLIESNLPIGMTNGDYCTVVPQGSSACDHIFEVGHPVQSWGTQVLVANLPNRPSGSIYRILASANNTTVTQDGVDIGTIQRGGYLETPPIPGDVIFAANQPIFVIQFMTGQSSPGASTGDPAMGNMIPSAQYLDEYTFSTVGENQFSENFVTIIARNSDVALVSLDGKLLNSEAFIPIGGSGFSVARESIDSGTHQTASPNPHGITVEGYNGFDSYIYPGGALFEFINPTGDANPPICSGGYTTGDIFAFEGEARDDRPSEDTNGNNELDEGEDLNNNGEIDEDTGIFFVRLLEGAQNLVLDVGAFVPGAGAVPFTVYAEDPNQPAQGVVRATDGAGNTCQTPVAFGFAELPNEQPAAPPTAVCAGEMTSVQLSSGVPAQLIGLFSFAWSTDCPGGVFDDPAASDPILTIDTSDNCNLTCTATVTITLIEEQVTFMIPVEVTVDPTGKPPVNVAPVALDQVEVTTCNLPIVFEFDCRDRNGDAMSVAIQTANVDFDGEIVVDGMTGAYTPPVGTNGLFYVRYTCDDGEFTSEPADVALWVLTCDASDGGAGSPLPGGGQAPSCPGDMSLAMIMLTFSGIALMGYFVRRR